MLQHLNIAKVLLKKRKAPHYELRVTSYELRATNYELRATNYELRVTSYELRATKSEAFASLKLYFDLITSPYAPVVRMAI